MGNVETDPQLLERMRAATTNFQSNDAIFEQKTSFIQGAMSSDSDISKERVEEILARHEGRRPTLK